MNLFKLENKKGFTLIEALVAISILIIAAIGPLSLLGKAISDGNFAKNQLIASYLGQEAMDLVINKRDYNSALSVYYLGHSTFDGFSACTKFEPCNVSVNQSNGIVTLAKCGAKCQIYQDNEGRYSYNVSSNPTIFFRKIWFEGITIDNGTYADVAERAYIQVDWSNKGVPAKPYIISTILFSY